MKVTPTIRGRSHGPDGRHPAAELSQASSSPARRGARGRPQRGSGLPGSQGGHALAGALLVERLAAGDGRARTALAEVAAGRWAAAVELLENLATSPAEDDVDASG